MNIEKSIHYVNTRWISIGIVIIVPIFIIASSRSAEPYLELTSTSAAVLSALLIPIQMLIFHFVFFKLTGSPESIRNAMWSRKLLLKALFGSLIALALLFLADYLMYESILTITNVSTVEKVWDPQLKLAINGTVLWIFMASILSVFPTLDYRFNFGRAFAYLTLIKLPKLNLEDKSINLLLGFESYEKYLAETFELRIKNTDLIHSYFLCKLRDNKLIELFTQSFKRKNSLIPAYYLKGRFDPKNREFFTKAKSYEKFERWARIIIPLIAVILGAIGLIVQFVIPK